MKNLIMLTSIILALLLVLHFVLSRTLVFKEEVLIKKNIDDAWEVLGNQFTMPHLWATNFITSEPGGSPKLNDLDYLHRATTTASGENWQEIDEFDPSNYYLSYHISKGLPGIAKEGTGTWQLTNIGDEECQISVEFSLVTKGLPGFLMSPIVSKKVGQASKEIVEEFQYFVENGKAHPRKLASKQDLQ